jgi:uncharacterized glyoxalase superfamily protein PhnB
MAVNPIPEGYGTVTPYMQVNGAARLIEYFEKAFGAKTLSQARMPDGSVVHAEVQIGDTKVMIGEASDRWPARPGGFYMYVENCDETYRSAIAAGGTSLREPTTEFYGDRSSGVEDPCGNQWWISTHVEDVSEEEIGRRMEEVMKARADVEGAQ